MKRMAILLLAVFLTGCAPQPAYETMADTLTEPPAATAQPTRLVLPEDAAVAVMQDNGDGVLYLCDGYEVCLQTYPGGDIHETLLDATGFSVDALRPVQTKREDCDRYDCVFITAGEGEEQVCRLALIDDGSFHYVLTAMAPASRMEGLADRWRQMFDAFAVGEPINTGS